jgi:hypothetical protein
LALITCSAVQLRSCTGARPKWLTVNLLIMLSEKPRHLNRLALIQCYVT